MKTRTLSQLCFVSMIVIIALLHRFGLPWWTMLAAWLISGGTAFDFGLSHKSPERKWDLIEVGMLITAILFGLISLFVTSFMDGEEHDNSRSEYGGYNHKS